MNRTKSKSVKNLIEAGADMYGSEDPIDIILGKAKKLSIKAIASGFGGPPYSMIQLAKSLGITIRANSDIGDACIFFKDDEPILEYNPFNSRSRINFSIAHEIAHTFFPDWKSSVNYRYGPRSSVDYEVETLCNIGAAELLLPYGIFSETVSNLPSDSDTIFRLSEMFDASLESVMLRYVETSQHPAAMAMYTRDINTGSLKLGYSKSRIKHLNGKFNDIPHTSEFPEYHRPGETWSGVEEWSGRTYKVIRTGISPVKGTDLPRVGVLFVPESSSTNRVQLIEEYGDATEPKGIGKKIILQLVNTKGALGAGFGRALKKKYPMVEARLHEMRAEKLLYLGNYNLIELSDDLSVFQVVAQDGFSRTKSKPDLLDIQAFRKGLCALVKIAAKTKSTIHTYPIGSGQAGSRWELTKGILVEELVAKGVETTVYFLSRDKSKRRSGNLNIAQTSLFE